MSWGSRGLSNSSATSLEKGVSLRPANEVVQSCAACSPGIPVEKVGKGEYDSPGRLVRGADTLVGAGADLAAGSVGSKSSNEGGAGGTSDAGDAGAGFVAAALDTVLVGTNGLRAVVAAGRDTVDAARVSCAALKTAVEVRVKDMVLKYRDNKNK